MIRVYLAKVDIGARAFRNIIKRMAINSVSKLQNVVVLLQMELAEARILALRRALDDSLKVYQGEQAAVRRANSTVVRRPLTVLFRSKNAALLDISVSFVLFRRFCIIFTSNLIF